MRHVKIPKERIREWLNALDTAKRYADQLHEALGPVTVLLHGSFARGDFNLWSDIDLIIISSRFTNTRPLDRYNILPDNPPRVEPIPLTPEEFLNLLEKPAWKQALTRGTVIIRDDLNITKKLHTLKIKTISITSLYNKIKSYSY